MEGLTLEDREMEYGAIILLVWVFLVLRRADNSEKERDYNYKEWRKWESEYWYLRSLKQNKHVKLSFLEHGRDTKRDEMIG